MTNKVNFVYSADSSVDISSINPDSTSTTLKPAVYILRYAQMRGFYLEAVKDRFSLPSPLFGSADQRADKIITTYSDRYQQGDSTGVLLTGFKGSGKTLLSEVVCNRMLDQGVPIILIQQGFGGPEFNTTINNLGNCVIMIDEFAKVYNERGEDSENQNALLTLMDGTMSKPRMFLFTENNTRSINSYLLGRTGRVFYHYHYDKIETEVVQEYCTHFGLPQEVIDEILEIISYCKSFSFDLLKALVEEWSRYPDQPVEDLIKDMNIPYSRANSQKCWKVKKVIETSTNNPMFVSTKDSTGISAGYGDYIYLYSSVAEADAAGNPDSEDFDEDAGDIFQFYPQNLVKEDGFHRIYENTDYVVVLEYDGDSQATDYNKYL